MSTGQVKWFDSKKGYGFIIGEQGQDVFVHYTSIVGEGFRSLKDGENVNYELVTGEKGDQARNVVREAKAAEMAQGTQPEAAETAQAEPPETAQPDPPETPRPEPPPAS